LVVIVGGGAAVAACYFVVEHTKSRDAEGIQIFRRTCGQMDGQADSPRAQQSQQVDEGNGDGDGVGIRWDGWWVCAML